ncbi:MAG: choline dehydrogenase [Sphingobium sp.]|nr:choline dehydrogenase [Sphingobium sp.]
MSFDYIIVGAGSAGCVLANRLTADLKTRVLLLESGNSHRHFLLDMPLGFMRALRQPRFTWPFMSEPEPHLNGRRIPLPRGRVLGGSSSINGMFYMRGHSSDYDGWRQGGCEGWSFAEVLPYFKRMETHWRGAGPWHGGDGPLHVVPVATKRLLHHPLMATAEAAGFPTTDDLSAEQQEGFARGELTITPGGRRASAARAYLDEALRRPNLTVVSGALARRVLLDGRRAIGVEYGREGMTEQAFAAREVILAGGAYNSPQLLMLSGIGPAEHLRERGIEPVLDLPGVGRNLSEHPRVPVHFGLKKPVSFLIELRADRVVRWVMQWKLTGTGAFASQLNSCNIVIRTREELSRPDIQLWSNPIRMDAETWFPLVKPRQRDLITADVILLHPRSRGWVELGSTDPAASPRITLNNFSDTEDLRTARDGIRIARRIYRTDPQAGLTGEEVLPGEQLQSDDELDAHIRATAQVTQHPVGTCAMGHRTMSVVDPQLRVHGIEGLRVVDASIMPDVPGGNTNAPTIMVAEKASDMIRGLAPLSPEYPDGESRSCTGEP